MSISSWIGLVALLFILAYFVSDLRKDKKRRELELRKMSINVLRFEIYTTLEPMGIAYQNYQSSIQAVLDAKREGNREKIAKALNHWRNALRIWHSYIEQVKPFCERHELEIHSFSKEGILFKNGQRLNFKEN